MNEIRLRFLSSQDSFIFSIAASTDNDVIRDFLSIFLLSSDEKNYFFPFHQNSPELVNNIREFTSKIENQAPQIHKLRQSIERLLNAEYFYMYPGSGFSQEESISIGNYLVSLNTKRDYELLNSEMENIFGAILRDYEIKAYDNKRRIFIGEPDKKKRICRFCGKKMPEVQFRKKAHVISESLGNKSIIINEECDTCNEAFGKEIELDIAEFLSTFRTFFSVTGKEGIPTTKGRNFEFRHVKDREFILKYQQLSPQNLMFPHDILLLTNPIKNQNIYKALCKYALSAADKDDLKYFTDTIKWLHGEILFSDLPRVALGLSYVFMKDNPAILLYKRKRDVMELPYMVGEFHFTCWVFIFIIPLSSRDEMHFNDTETFKHFWNAFPFHRSEIRWEFLDLSRNIEQPFELILRFKKT